MLDIVRTTLLTRLYTPLGRVYEVFVSLLNTPRIEASYYKIYDSLSYRARMCVTAREPDKKRLRNRAKLSIIFLFGVLIFDQRGT